jgi:hypothetical protein
MFASASGCTIHLSMAHSCWNNQEHAQTLANVVLTWSQEWDVIKMARINQFIPQSSHDFNKFNLYIPFLEAIMNPILLKRNGMRKSSQRGWPQQLSKYTSSRKAMTTSVTESHTPKNNKEHLNKVSLSPDQLNAAHQTHRTHPSQGKTFTHASELIHERKLINLLSSWNFLHTRTCWKLFMQLFICNRKIHFMIPQNRLSRDVKKLTS